MEAEIGPQTLQASELFPRNFFRPASNPIYLGIYGSNRSLPSAVSHFLCITSRSTNGSGHLTVSSTYSPPSTTRTENPPGPIPEGRTIANVTLLVVVPGSSHVEAKCNGRKESSSPSSSDPDRDLSETKSFSSVTSATADSLLFLGVPGSDLVLLVLSYSSSESSVARERQEAAS